MPIIRSCCSLGCQWLAFTPKIKLCDVVSGGTTTTVLSQGHTGQVGQSFGVVPVQAAKIAKIKRMVYFIAFVFRKTLPQNHVTFDVF